MRPSEQTGSVVITDAQLVDLRLKYEAAYSAYQSCVLALEAMWRGGEAPPAELLERHAAALRHLNVQRTRFREALVRVAFLSDDPPH